MKKNYKIVINGREYKYSIKSAQLADALAIIIAIWYNGSAKYSEDLLRVIIILALEIMHKENIFTWWSLPDSLVCDIYYNLPLRIDKYTE